VKPNHRPVGEEADMTTSSDNNERRVILSLALDTVFAVSVRAHEVLPKLHHPFEGEIGRTAAELTSDSQLA
jgi:hypothetical protein